MNPFTQHIPFTTLADYAEDRLAAQERLPVEQHVAGCSRCSADVAWLQQTVDLMRTDDAPDAPAHVIARAVRLMRPQQPQPSPLRRLVAVLQWDSASLQPHFGVRSGQGVERQLLLNAAEYDVDLRVTPQGSAWVVAGQVLGPGGKGEVELRSDADIVETTLNEQAEFVLPPVPTNRYTLTVRLPDVEVSIAPLELGA